MREAVDVAKSQDKDKVVTLSTGVRAILTPVASSLIQDVMSQVKDPKPPMWMNPEKEQEEPNYNHPDYIEAMNQAEQDRNDAALDAVILFGVELVDGVPDDDWEKKLRYLEKRKRIDLSEYDLEDEFEREFVYKRHIAVAGDDFTLIGELSGVPQGEARRARSTFLGDEERDSVGPASDEGQHQD